MKTNFLQKLFYPPNYLSMKAAGVDIRNRSIRYIEVADKRGNLFIKNFGTVSLPPNTVENGEIINKDALVKALLEVKGKISSDFVKVSIPEEKTYIFDTQILLVKGSDERESIEFKLEENVPLKIDEISFGYDIIKKEEKEISDSLVASVSAIPKKVIENFTEVFTFAGLAPIGFEIESRMMARAVVPKDDKKTIMIINIKEDSTLLSLVVSGIVRFSSTVAIGDGIMKENLSKTNLLLSSGEISDSLSHSGTDVENEIFYSLLNIFSVIKDEVEKFNEYLAAKSEGKGVLLPKTVDEIILCGASATLPGFINHISQNIDKKIMIANVWNNVFDVKNRIPSIKFHDSLDFATAIGLAI